MCDWMATRTVWPNWISCCILPARKRTFLRYSLSLSFKQCLFYEVRPHRWGEQANAKSEEESMEGEKLLHLYSRRKREADNSRQTSLAKETERRASYLDVFSPVIEGGTMKTFGFFHLLHVELFCASATQLCSSRYSSELLAFSTAKKSVRRSEQFCKWNSTLCVYCYILYVYQYYNINIVCTILFLKMLNIY